jgi:hypothetical protein
MKLLRCKRCRGEMDIIGGDHSIYKEVECRECGFTNADDQRLPEITVIKKRPDC